MNQGKLLVISGPSGAGKGTICSNIFKDFENIVFSVSMTTRKPRSGEVEGESYYFVNKATFEKMIDEDGFFEHAKVFENYYGTPKKPVMEQLAKGIDVILDIDIQGAMQVKEVYPEAILLFILPPSIAELKKRIVGRGSEDEASLNLRLSKAVDEISYLKHYDYAIVNDDLKEAVSKVKAIIVTEHARVDETAIATIKKYEEECKDDALSINK